MKSDLVKAFELMVYFTAEQSGITKPGINRIHDPKLFAEMLQYCENQRRETEKYFTPTIEDLRVGYECEVLPINESLGWEAGRLSYYSGYEGPGLYNLYPFWYTTRKGNYGRIKTMIHDFKQIRVPYLTTEQIEKEGWKFVHQGQMDTFQTFEKGQNLYMHFYNQQRTITIIKGNCYTVYTGNCPSINEFRIIMKLLNIK